MTRTERLLRLARQRGDLLAVATLEGEDIPDDPEHLYCGGEDSGGNHMFDREAWNDRLRWTEAELREAWGR